MSYLNLKKCLQRINNGFTLKKNSFTHNGIFVRGLTSSRINFNQPSSNEYPIGSLIEGYKLEKVTPVKELNLVAYELNHEKSGARHLHIAADDTNNAFSVSFKTPVKDDTGVAHILEHLVLCGSKKYPVHDPFFKMSLRSVSTFMNAMTFPDHTTYPFSSVNKKDFYNLLSVYMDCVFNPCLRYNDFLQEAWRIEHQIANDDKSPLVFKGVVFNEMKGVLNSQSSVQDFEYSKHLLPTTYSYNYGGNPLDIIDLRYNELVEFHCKFYHPSNSLFITYGNIAMEEHLKTLNATLSELIKSETVSNKDDVILPKEVSWNKPRRAESQIPYDPLLPVDKQSIFLLGFKMNPSNYNRDIFVMSVLSQLLLVGPNSAFHKYLLTKNLGSDYCDHVGLNSYTNDPTFSVGLKGVNDKDIPEIESVILSTLEQVKKTGFTENHILGVMKETELAIKHIGSNSGINYATSIPTNWAHGHNPSDCLIVKDRLDYVYQHYKDGIFEKIVDDDLLNNSHRLTLHLKPDIQFTEKLTQQETILLNKKVANANKDSFEAIERKVEDPSVVDKILPKVTLEDLSDEIPLYVAHNNIIGDETPLQTSVQPTNGLGYVRINVNTNSLPLLLRPYLPLFSHIITQIGANEMSHEKIAELIALNSFPYSARPLVRVDLNNANEYDKGLMFSSFCPYDNTIKMMEIWNAIFSKPMITNDEHMRILISEYLDAQLTSVVDNGHSYAMSRACSHLTRPYAYRELLGGWTQVEFAKHLADLLQKSPSNMDSICEKLIQIASYLFDRSKLSCFVVCEDHYMPQMTNVINSFVTDVPANFSEPFPVSSSQKCANNKNQTKEFIYMPSRVNFNASAYRVPSFLHPDFPHFKVLSLLLTSKFLLPNIREIGGAYGAGVFASDGCLSFYSYRDPNLLTTYENFEKSIQWLINKEYEMKSFEEAKVRAIGSILSPVPPSKRTLSLFTNGITNEHILKYRDTIKSCTPEDIERITKMYLCENENSDDQKQFPFVSFATIGENFSEIKNDDSWSLNKKYQTSK